MPRPIVLVISILGLVLLACVGLIGLLALNGQAVPDVLQNIAVGSLTAIGGILVPSTLSSGGAHTAD